MELFKLDPKVKDFLTKANLSADYETQFKEARIDMDVIPFLGQDEIKQLIHPLGDQIRFNKHLKSYIQDEGIRESPFYIHRCESADTVVLDPCLNVSRNSTATFEETPNKLVRERPFGTPSLCDLRSLLSSEKEMQELEIREIIANHSIFSKSLLRKFSGSGGMGEHEQGLIVKILVDHAINTFINDLACHRSSQVFDALAQKIVSLFPKEDKTTFFIPPEYNDLGLQTVRARGKLIERYYYVLRKNKDMEVSPNIRKMNLALAKSCQKKAKKRKCLAAELKLDSDDDNLETYEANKEMLLSLNESWDFILKTWQKTSLRRLREVYSLDQPQEANDSPLTVSSLTKHWPIIKDPRAYSLLEIDFLNLYKMESSLFIEKWSTLKVNLKSILSLDVKDKSYLQQLKSSSDDSCEGEDGILLAGIPYLFSPKNIKSLNGSIWRPSTAESQEGFFSIVRNSSEIPLKIANRRSRLATHGVSTQPFVIAQGSSLLDLRKCLVCIEDFMYEFNAPIDAVNSCMQCIHALGAEYDLEARRSWLFLQKCFFGIDTSYDDDKGVKEPRVDSLCNRMINQDFSDY